MPVIVPVILCGGSGTRLWPLSRAGAPKQLLALIGPRTLLQNTVSRALSISGASPDHLLAVTQDSLKPDIAAQLHDIDPDLTRHILGEPLSRNTAGAIAYAALYVRKVFGADALMWVLPSDHHVADEDALKEPFQQAVEAAGKGLLVTFGLRPTRPETGYGYIKKGSGISIETFVEKPDLETARAFVDSGDYLWNSGMFLFSAGTVLENFRTHAPAVLAPLEEAFAQNGDMKTLPLSLYAQIPSMPFDIAIMEKAERRAVIAGAPPMFDIGSWPGFSEALDKDDNGNAVTGNVRLLDSHDCLIHGEHRYIAAAGLNDLIVADTPDALLIMARSHADRVKSLTPSDKTPFRILSRSPHYEIRERLLHSSETYAPLPEDSLSWTVIEGEAAIADRTIKAGESFSSNSHPGPISNPGKVPLRLVEIKRF